MTRFKLHSGTFHQRYMLFCRKPQHDTTAVKTAIHPSTCFHLFNSELWLVPMTHRVRGGVHAGQVGKLSQANPDRHTPLASLETPVNLSCVSLDFVAFLLPSSVFLVLNPVGAFSNYLHFITCFTHCIFALF